MVMVMVSPSRERPAEGRTLKENTLTKIQKIQIKLAARRTLQRRWLIQSRGGVVSRLKKVKGFTL